MRAASRLTHWSPYDPSSGMPGFEPEQLQWGGSPRPFLLALKKEKSKYGGSKMVGKDRRLCEGATLHSKSGFLCRVMANITAVKLCSKSLNFNE